MRNLLCTTLNKFENTQRFFLTCDTLPGDGKLPSHGGNDYTDFNQECNHDNGWMEGKRKKRKREKE